MLWKTMNSPLTPPGIFHNMPSCPHMRGGVSPDIVFSKSGEKSSPHAWGALPVSSILWRCPSPPHAYFFCSALFSRIYRKSSPLARGNSVSRTGAKVLLIPHARGLRYGSSMEVLFPRTRRAPAWLPCCFSSFFYNKGDNNMDMLIVIVTVAVTLLISFMEHVLF